MPNIPEGLPVSAVILLLILNLFRSQIGDFFTKIMPGLFARHMRAFSRTKTDIREHEQLKELTAIEHEKKKEVDKLTLELRTLRTTLDQNELLINQQVEREAMYTALIEKEMSFLQKLIDNQFIATEASIIAEIKALRAAFELFAKDGRQRRTQELLLKRLEQPSTQSKKQED